jgi:hypothetical protein
VKQRAELRRAPTAERHLKIFLRLSPARAGCAQPCRAGLGQMHDFAPAVDAARYDLDQSFALEGQDIAAERGPIHHQTLRQRVNCHGSRQPQSDQDRELCGPQAA